MLLKNVSYLLMLSLFLATTFWLEAGRLHDLLAEKPFNEKTFTEALAQASQEEVNEIDGEGLTPLLLAIRAKNLKALTLLLNHEQIDVNLPTYELQTPIELASTPEDLTIYNLLLEGPEIDYNHTYAIHPDPKIEKIIAHSLCALICCYVAVAGAALYTFAR